MNSRRKPANHRNYRDNGAALPLMDRLPEWLRRVFEVNDGGRRGYSVATRAHFMIGLIGIVVALLVARAFWMMIVNKDFYMSKGEARFERNLPIAVSRGMITDRNGEPLAVSTPVESVWGNPQELFKHQNRWPELAKALNIPFGELQRKLAQKEGKEFLYLKRRINPDEAKRILAHKIPGVASQREYRRYYPQAESIAQVLGFTNVDDKGQEGLELAFESWLKGKPGEKRVIRSRQGDIVESELVKAPEPGKELVLSLDRRVQYLAYKELHDMVVRSGAASGSAVIVDVNSGEVLAMANVPTFNPNATVQKNIDAHRNRAVTDLVEPGSTMKPITVAAGLTAGKITPNTVFSTEGGRIANGPFSITDTHNYGSLTVTGIITKSSNVGSAKIARLLPNDYFYEYVHKMGYGSKPRSGFPGESSGLLPKTSNWDGTTKSTMAYGYGLSATPIQIAMAYAALANGGRLLTPTFVKGGKVESKQVIEPEVAAQVMRMMETVTKPGGTATQAAVLGYKVAGKTGTARMVSETGGYSRKYNAFFAGVVPVDNPRFAMVVVVNDPDTSKGYYGGLISGPVFRSVMEGTLRLMDVPPDDIQTWIAANAKAGHPSVRSPVDAAIPPVAMPRVALPPQSAAAAAATAATAQRALPKPVALGVGGGK